MFKNKRLICLIIASLLLVLATGCKGGETTSEKVQEKETFKVTWLNYDGSKLEVDRRVERGTFPEYNGKQPTKKEDATYTYEFIGWDKDLAPVQSDITYTAKFKATKKQSGSGTSSDDGLNYDDSAWDKL